jgi:hypothetical protein
MNYWKFFVAGAALLLAAPSAMGANVESRAKAARKACLVGDVDRGVGILADLYVDTEDPGYLYNQGRCFEQNGKNEQAILRFKEYLRKAKASQEETDAVLKRIDELHGSPGRREAQPEPAAATVPRPEVQPIAALPPAAPAASANQPSAAVENTTDPLGLSSRSAPPPELQESPPIHRRWWFWTGIGAAVAGGVVTTILLRPKSAPTRSTCDLGVACAP